MQDHQPKAYTALSDAEITAFAHLYRGEVYRSTLWRTRLDTSTNWAVVTLGIALSIAFATPSASPLPLLLVGILIIFFLMLEARRYRYFNVWRARCRWMETHFFVPMLDREAVTCETDWQKVLAKDYLYPAYHVPLRVAIGRRIRRNYFWILLIQTVAYLGKLLVHPTPLTSVDDLYARAAIGPVHGGWLLALGAVYLGSWGLISVISWRDDKRRAAKRGNNSSGMG
ncbi:DUF2270 domain-containing protein [Celeribacter litoreus]|uniref:DUF2270 domain-containing protein n=1 Tax=Celeribacter litoreus TaxID=2876714 RepID=UPI001CCEECF2|nr:DUF2270 domain-containing protein [Celeribacter litoreus]MCA0042817.1 DUF2270 domain-containing protein [Celeribacter litoreus]